MTATQANFFKDWAMTASHEVTGKLDSELHLKLGPVTTSNKTFLEWSTSMVNSMLGPEQNQTATQGTATPQSSPMSAELTEVMKAMTKMAEMSALLAQQSSRTGEKAKEAASEILKEDKSKYSEHMIAALCGYCKLDDPSSLPDIWHEFEKHSSPASWRVAMQEWVDAIK